LWLSSADMKECPPRGALRLIKQCGA
jgi:hypothetical protein